ncbi:MAG: hypothetical protein KJ847_05815 [Firmicutes bacterium]|nr:hypothetical protein [Bacillota bacterium]
MIEMKTKTLTIIVGILLVLPLVSAGNITNFQVAQGFSDFTAGEIATIVFSFDYPDVSQTYLRQIQNAPLVMKVDISSDDSDYPVWKGDFELSGSMEVDNRIFPDRHYEFECTEDDFVVDYPDEPFEINNIPDGTFYCTNEEFLAMDLKSENQVVLNIKSDPALWPGEYNFFVELFYPERTEKILDMIINSPFEEIYPERGIVFNVTMTRDAKLEYINWNDNVPRWRTLCRSCDEYGESRIKKKSFKDGEYNLTIKATDDVGQVREENILFSVDSKKPRISKTLPKRNSFTNGSDFYIKYTEDNLKEILININSEKIPTACHESGKNKECYVDLDLSSYDGQFIEYWFEVSDYVRSVGSRKTKVKVDTTSPVLTVNSPKNDLYGRRVPFNISVSEDVKLEYIDNSALRPKWKRLCSNCDEYGESRTKTKSFRKRVYEISIRATDKAGNINIKEIEFVVDY